MASKQGQYVEDKAECVHANQLLSCHDLSRIQSLYLAFNPINREDQHKCGHQGIRSHNDVDDGKVLVGEYSYSVKNRPNCHLGEKE